MTQAIERHGLSERRACSVIQQKRSSQRYQSYKDDTELREKLLRLAAERRRFGYRRLAVFVRREGDFSNIKRIRRVYRELELGVKRRKGRKRAIGTRLPLPHVDLCIGERPFVNRSDPHVFQLIALGIEAIQCIKKARRCTVESIAVPGRGF